MSPRSVSSGLERALSRSLQARMEVATPGFSARRTPFPAPRHPQRGRFVIQAKHTGAADASCSDRAFVTLVTGELPKNHQAGIRPTPSALPALHEPQADWQRRMRRWEKLIISAGATSAHVIARERLHAQLDLRQDVVRAMPALRLLQEPLLLEPTDLADVIHGIHGALTNGGTPYDSAHNFNYLKKESEKNRLNGLSDAYYDYIADKSIPYFPDIKRFLENPRNGNLVNLYHDSADELKQQIIIRRSEYDTFDEIFRHIYQHVVTSNPSLTTKRRYVNTLLHYMYFDCRYRSKCLSPISI